MGQTYNATLRDVYDLVKHKGTTATYPQLELVRASAGAHAINATLAYARHCTAWAGDVLNISRRTAQGVVNAYIVSRHCETVTNDMQRVGYAEGNVLGMYTAIMYRLEAAETRKLAETFTVTEFGATTHMGEQYDYLSVEGRNADDISDDDQVDCTQLYDFSSSITSTPSLTTSPSSTSPAEFLQENAVPTFLRPRSPPSPSPCLTQAMHH